MAAKWPMITEGPERQNARTVDVAFGSTQLPDRLPAEANVPRPNLTAVLVAGKYTFTSNMANIGPVDPTPPVSLKPGQHVYLEYDVPNAKEWAGVPLPTLHQEDRENKFIYAGIVHDDQAKLRISDDMTSIIIRTSGRTTGNQTRSPTPLVEVAQNVFVMDPAGFFNHFKKHAAVLRPETSD